MDNATRSERSRNAALEAALVVMARDGPGRLTLDAISRQSGISKGGLMHQFGSKEAVLKALIDRQTEHFRSFTDRYLAEHGGASAQPHLAAQIATLREASTTPSSIVFAVLGAAAQEPSLLQSGREADAAQVRTIRSEAADPDMAVLRWVAAWGLALTAMLGISPLDESERDRLFTRLLDESGWPGADVGTKPASRRRAAPRRAE